MSAASPRSTNTSSTGIADSLPEGWSAAYTQVLDELLLAA
jgi:hypothetical protein